VQWTSALVKETTLAERALARLGGFGQRFANPHRLCRLFLKREAEMSSRIERTYAGLRTIVLADELADSESESQAVTEVNNNYRLLKFVFDRLGKTPLTHAAVRHMQSVLFLNIERPPRDVGRYRTIQNWIGSSNDIRDARHVPPPPTRVDELMRTMIDYINTPDDFPPVARAACVHYQFEAIHPFTDGNGRVGRALVMLQLHRDGVLDAPLLNPSAELERNRRQYYDCLLDVTEQGNWTQWIIFFSRAIAFEAERSIEKLQLLEALRHEYRERVASYRTAKNLLRIVEDLLSDPAVTTTRLSQQLQIDPANASRLVARLVEVGILSEVTGLARNRVYLAQDVLNIFSPETSGEASGKQ